LSTPYPLGDVPDARLETRLAILALIEAALSGDPQAMRTILDDVTDPDQLRAMAAVLADWLKDEFLESLTSQEAAEVLQGIREDVLSKYREESS
jgi:hypothetical protein